MVIKLKTSYRKLNNITFIVMGEIYKRKCPACDKELVTRNKYWFAKANKENKLCGSCSLKGREFSESHKRKLSESHANVSNENNPFYGRRHDEKTKRKCGEQNIGQDRFTESQKYEKSRLMKGDKNTFYGKHHTNATLDILKRPKTEEHKDKLRQSLKGMTSPMKGRQHTDESKRKMRISAVKRLKNIFGNSFHPSVNPREGLFFERLEYERGWDGIYHQKTGTQHHMDTLGYWVDYYEPTLNIVVEYDETNHYDSNWELKDSDKKRQNEIINELNCKFYRYNEVKKILYEVN